MALKPFAFESKGPEGGGLMRIVVSQFRSLVGAKNPHLAYKVGSAYDDAQLSRR